MSEQLVVSKTPAAMARDT